MDAQAHDVVGWLLLVGGTAVGALVSGLAQRHWWRESGEAYRTAASTERHAPTAPTTEQRARSPTRLR